MKEGSAANNNCIVPASVLSPVCEERSVSAAQMVEFGFVTPVARKKRQAREQIRVRTNRQLWKVSSLAIVLWIIIYSFFFLEVARPSAPNEKNANGLANNGGVRGGGRAWVNVYSQPFVSANEYHTHNTTVPASIISFSPVT
jgi:hypothetical protein